MRRRRELSITLRRWTLAALGMAWLPLLALPASFPLLTSAGFAAQKSALDEEEEEPPAAKKPPAKSALDEEEEEPPAAKKPPAKSALDEEEEPPAMAPPRRSGLDEEEAPPGEKPKAPADGDEDDKDIAYDMVYFEVGKSVKRWKIALCAEFIEPPWPPPKEFTFQVLLKKSKKREVIQATKVISIEFFENRVLDEVAASLTSQADRLCRPGIAVDLSPPPIRAKFAAAERQLSRAIAEHDSAVQSNLRGGPFWETKVRQKLLDAVFNLRLGEVDLSLNKQEYAQAVAQCDRLRIEGAEHDDPREQALSTRLQKALLEPARKKADAGEYEAARVLLGELSGRFPGQTLTAAVEFARRLKNEAAEVVKQARALAKSDPAQAQRMIEQAAGIWPELFGLDEARQELGFGYPILECAYQELPHEFSPLAAQTPVERHAVSLLFESLVRWSDADGSGGHYQPQLAEGRPVPRARGRQFQLPRRPLCRWSDYSDDAPYICIASDVVFTVNLMHKRPAASAPPAWSRLVAPVDRSLTGGDSFLAAIRLKRDYWQPMSLMDFYVLPRHCFPQGGTNEELAAFSRQPIGTGPYMLAEQSDDRARFVANPNYRREGLPKIREIRFHRREQIEAVEAFLRDDIHLIYGLSTQQVNRLESERRRVVPLKSPSVWFLAPNYRRDALRNPDLRLAIANCVQRRAIVDSCFRVAGGRDHGELTGPFPANSWAYNASVKPYSAENAQALADEARKKLGSIPKLKLVYPAGREDVAAACGQIENDAKKIGIEIDAVEAAAGDFYRQVLYRHDFDLAYWRHDFYDENFWLGPLLDQDEQARAPGGPNFMGYEPDASVVEFLTDLASHKQFPTVRARMHKLHEHLAQTAAVIPLWQLDTYVAVSDRLLATPEPTALFANVEQWILKPRSK